MEHWPFAKQKIKIDCQKGVTVPAYQSQGASGADLRAHLKEPVVLAPGERKLIPTGLAIEVPPGFEAQVRSRSGLALKQGVIALNSPGTIDSDYRGEIKIILCNLGQSEMNVEPGMRIAQLVLAPVLHMQFIPAPLSDTERGSGGFGQTGMN